MLEQVAEGVLVHQSAFIQSNAVVVRGPSGALLIDPGMTSTELAAIADDLSDLGETVVAGFATHPDWDHVLWHARLGDAPRYGTARCAAVLRDLLSNEDWKEQVTPWLPPECADEVPLDDRFGRITGLPAGTSYVPWDGPRVRIIEHQGHAPGHAALWVEEPGVLVAGDMLSDVLVPMLDLGDATDPIDDYLTGLERLASVADDIDVLIPGHGSVARADQVRARIEQDRAYVQALRDGGALDDPRIGSSAKPGWEWVSDVHDGQRQRLGQKGEDDATPG